MQTLLSSSCTWWSHLLQRNITTITVVCCQKDGMPSMQHTLHAYRRRTPHHAMMQVPLQQLPKSVVCKHSRPCKEKRNRYKKLVKRLEVQILQDPSSFDFETISLPPSLQRNDRQRVKLMERMNSFHYRAKIHDEFEVNMVTL